MIKETFTQKASWERKPSGAGELQLEGLTAPSVGTLRRDPGGPEGSFQLSALSEGSAGAFGTRTEPGRAEVPEVTVRRRGQQALLGVPKMPISPLLRSGAPPLQFLFLAARSEPKVQMKRRCLFAVSRERIPTC